MSYYNINQPMPKHIFLLVIFVLFTYIPTFAIAERQSEAYQKKCDADKCFDNQNFSEALEKYTEALALANENKESRVAVSCVGNIANIYSGMGETDLAIRYYKKGFAEATRLKDLALQHKFLICIVAVYCMEGKIKEAEHYNQLFLQLPPCDVTLTRYYQLRNQGLIASAKNDLASAKYYQRQALDYSYNAQLGYTYEAAQMFELADLDIKEKNYDSALDYNHKRLAIGICNKDLALQVDSYLQLSKIYKMMGDKEAADSCRIKYLVISDSVFKQSRHNAAKNKLFAYESDMSDRAISELTDRSTLQIILIITIFILLITVTVFSIIIVRRNHRIIEQQRILIDKNDELVLQGKESRILREQYIMTIAKDTPLPEIEPEALLTYDDTCLDGELCKKNRELLTVEQRNLLISRISEIMDDVSIISRTDFSLPMLAQLVKSNVRYVSYAINETYGKNFKSYLNEFRIREACIKLRDFNRYGNKTIQTIYEELGFKSASNFIKAFKLSTGMTPSEYQRILKNKSNPQS